MGGVGGGVGRWSGLVDLAEMYKPAGCRYKL